MPQKPWKKRLHSGNPVVAAGIKMPKYDGGNTVHRRLAEIGKAFTTRALYHKSIPMK
ncbi:hypothetical protein [Infirmifilum sp.]|uniref:hypothetical protein n=1 Tax=Infirmifilum sp. TaxID=2856575 RepID=UPI003D117223